MEPPERSFCCVSTRSPLPRLLTTPLAPPIHTYLSQRSLARNRLSRFTYVEGDPDTTRDSERVLLDTGIKRGTIHSAGWVGIKPSAFDAPIVSAAARPARARERVQDKSNMSLCTHQA